MYNDLRSLRHRLAILLLAGPLFLSACATTQPVGEIADPLENVNRVSHAINKGVDRVALRPASQIYDHFVPGPVSSGVDNVVANLDHPGMVVNGLLQGNIDNSGHNLFRFLINSSLGLGGLFDVAASIGLERRPTDFGATLYTWGVAEGVYLELPLTGPSTVRNFAGTIVDGALNPSRLIFPGDQDRQALRRLRSVDLVGDRARNGRLVDELLYDSADSYIALRSLYIQNRRYTLGGGTSDTALDPFYDPFSDPFAQPFELPNRR